MAQIKITSREQALLILERLGSIKASKDYSFGNKDFPKQMDFINEDGPLNSALCTRRAGKSYGVGEKLFKKCYDYPGCTVLYLALTRDSAKRIMWKDVLKDIAKRKNIAYTANGTDLEMTLASNGSVIKLAGADADERQREKFLGGKYPYVVIDEAGSFSNDLEALVYEYLEPAVSDYNGTIDLIGTPTFFHQGFFCKVTEGKEPGWNIHKWNTFDNPFMPNWKERIEIIKIRNPKVEETPGYKRMYLGQWVIDDSNLIFKFNPEKDFVDKLPAGEISGQVLGIDLGWNDATAYSLSRYYDNDDCLYFIDAWKKSEQIIDAVVETIKGYITDYEIHTIVIDNASKQVVESLKVRFELYDVVIHAAEKTDKFEHIELMNSDFIMGRIKLLKPKTKALSDEYADLILDPNSRKKAEHPACENHLCDASLYAWRHARNYLERPLDPEICLEDRIEQEMENHFDEQQRSDNEYDFEWP